MIIKVHIFVYTVTRCAIKAGAYPGFKEGGAKGTKAHGKIFRVPHPLSPRKCTCGCGQTLTFELYHYRQTFTSRNKAAGSAVLIILQVPYFTAEAPTSNKRPPPILAKKSCVGLIALELAPTANYWFQG